jgi:hypothetical protein
MANDWKMEMLPEFEVWMESIKLAGELNIHGDAENSYIENRYCLGGTAGSWMDDNLIHVPASPKTEFTEFAKAIDLIAVDMNPWKRRNLQKMIVIDKEKDSDWYGGTVTYHVEKANLFSLWLKIKYDV